MKENAKVRFQTVIQILQISLKKLVLISKTPVFVHESVLWWDSKCI